MSELIENQQIPTPRTSLPTSPKDVNAGLNLEQNDSQIVMASTIDKLSTHGENSLDVLRSLVPYKTSMATITFNGTIWEKIDAIAEAGFDGVEIMTPDLEETTPQKLYQYCQSKNMQITVFQPFRDLEGYDDEQKFQEKLQNLENTFKIMKELHTDLLMCCANCLPESEISLDESTIVRQLAVAADLASKYNIRIAYENLSWATHINTLERLCHIVNRVNRPNFGICLDTFHINIHNSSLDFIDQARDRIFFVQYCDAPILKLNSILEYARNYRVFPGQGDYANKVAMLEKIYNNGYRGYLSLEVFNASFRESSGNCGAVADDALRGLLYLQAIFCDQYLGKQIFPSLKVEYATLNNMTKESNSCFTLSDLTLHMSSTSRHNFISNCKLLGNTYFCNNQTISTDVSVSPFPISGPQPLYRIFLTVNNRLDYNRQCLFIRSIFGMSHLEGDFYNITNKIGLPSICTFGYCSGGLRITLSLNEN